jgi:prepilin-type N-terminal cleavage/methylation domain-containing protein
MRATKPAVRGFTLVELLVAVALGLIVLAATTQLFKNGMDATLLVSQSSEMQQSARATLNLIAKDVSMAGSGLPPSGLALPNGAGAVPSFFAVDPSRAWLANNTYPANYMYGIIPGVGNGLESGGLSPSPPPTRDRTRSPSSITITLSPSISTRPPFLRPTLTATLSILHLPRLRHRAFPPSSLPPGFN